MADSTDTNLPQDTATPMGSPTAPKDTNETPKLDDAIAGGLLRPGADASNDDASTAPVVPPGDPPVEPPKDILASAPTPLVPPPVPQAPPEPVSETANPPVDIKPDVAMSALHDAPVEPAPAMPPSDMPAPKPEEILAPAVAAAAAGALQSESFQPDAGASPSGSNGASSIGKPRKKGKKSVLLGLIALFFFITTGLIFVFVTQRQQIADLRGRTAYTGFQCRLDDPNACNGNPQDCHCQNGDLCTGTLCESNIRQSCLNQGRAWCDNWQGFAKTCCVEGYVCAPSGPGCVQSTSYNYSQGNYGGNTPTNTPTRTPTHTPTNTPTNTPTGTPGNTPTNTPTGTPGDTPTNTPTGTPGNTPTNTPTGTPGDTPTNTPTPTKPEGATDTPTHTATPTQIVYAACNQTCTVNADCGSGLVCLDSVCRNPSCSESATCQCAVAAAPTPRIPVAGTGPTVLGASIIMGGMLLLLLGLLF